MDPVYWYRAAKSVGRNMLNTPGFVREFGTSGLRRDLQPGAPGVHILDLFPTAPTVEVDLGTMAYGRSNLDPMEQYILGLLCQLRQPRTIFEIGTYDGSSTLLMARNAPEAKVLTLDLPPEIAHAASVAEEATNAALGVGRKFASTEQSSQIEQLLGDSTSFDFSPWAKSIDLVLVDAAHDYRSVRADTKSAFELVSPGGVIVWDDYTVGWPGVVQAVDEIGMTIPGQILKLHSTDFAVWGAGDPTPRAG